MLAERAEDKEKFEAQAQEKKPPLLFAPAIFIDDDGQACYYWGQLYSHGVKMNPDMERGKPTSLGAGKPFGPGERIMGYQACDLKGGVYIDADPDGSAVS